MVLDMERYLENRRKYLENRSKYPLDELAKYAGTWIAWSPDGSRIVASSTNPDELDELVRAAGEDPTECLVEGIPDCDTIVGGGLGLEVS